jgi:hypothetical protein
MLEYFLFFLFNVSISFLFALRPEELSAAIAPLWDESHGDRQNELVVIGRHMDRMKVEAALQACLLTDEELKAAPVETWEKVRAFDLLVFYAVQLLLIPTPPISYFTHALFKIY